MAALQKVWLVCTVDSRVVSSLPRARIFGCEESFTVVEGAVSYRLYRAVVCTLLPLLALSKIPTVSIPEARVSVEPV